IILVVLLLLSFPTY
ncbi:type I toxin-antitoxin system Ibs family toxin, partial [Shigella flexneri]|nr:type I toxin-antitoxin system Ibs family toxin [Shigella flexneri]EFY6036621.1 type I toxin-antitoxin system Ibs family toxin [Shigella flexneri]MCC7884109.1 type I toxin-antitoxin system Ibs family toxin [Escherichia coli]NAI03129.1 type I toxin-antitoxin system Ibs family toxin [Escherichia coli]